MANVLVTGGTGFIGTRVCTALHQQGDTVRVLSRNPTRAQTKLQWAREFYGWTPETEKLPSEATSDINAVVHLAGETIAGRWNTEKKRRIRDSRVLSTRNLVTSFETVGTKPMCLSVPLQLDIMGAVATNTLQRCPPLVPIFSPKSVKSGKQKRKRRLRLEFG